MMMKENIVLKEYAAPELEIVVFDCGDVITSSPDPQTETKKYPMDFEEE